MMAVFKLFIRWWWVFGLALLTPVALPAGGCDSLVPEIRRTQIMSTQHIAFDSCFLRASPWKNSPILFELQPGTPISILRSWRNQKGNLWVQIKFADWEGIGPTHRRGWVNV